LPVAGFGSAACHVRVQRKETSWDEKHE